MARTESIYSEPQVNLNFASRTWYSQQGARGLHKTLGYDAKGQKFILPHQASLPRARSEEGWNPRHTLLLRNEGLQTNTRSYFDRRLEMPQPRKRNEPARKRGAMVPTWKLAYGNSDGSIDRAPAFEPMKSVLSPISRPAWQCRHMFATANASSPRAMLHAPPGMNPTDWNSGCHNGMRTYFDGSGRGDVYAPPLCNLPAFSRSIYADAVSGGSIGHYE